MESNGRGDRRSHVEWAALSGRAGLTVLLDSQAILWAIYEPEKLSNIAFELIRDKHSTLLVSDCSLWEISLKLVKGKLACESSLNRVYSRVAELD